MLEQGPLSGKVLGEKYLLNDLLGEGGFGAVYSAQHLVLDRPQAIKILLTRYVRNPKFRERFLREAQTLATLDHPYIVHIDDFIIEEREAQAYLVMPLVSGGTLHNILQRRAQQLPLEQVALYLEQISRALDYAHQHNVVHLDLKPQNLLVHADGRLLLSDFGLAHLIKQEELEGGSSLLYGTPQYKSPEHWRGEPEKSSDIYALGLILYEMLTSQRPFRGATPESIMMQHITKQPPPLRSLRPELPEHLEGVLQKALAKEPSQRYQSAEILLIAFHKAINSQPHLPAIPPREKEERYIQQEQVHRTNLELKHNNVIKQMHTVKPEESHQIQVFKERQTHRTTDEKDKQDTPQEDVLTMKFAIAKLYDYIQWFFLVIEAILLTRFLLKLIGADPTGIFSNFIFSMTDILLLPFIGIVPSVSLHANQAFEFSTLLAMIIYFLIFYALKRFLRLLISRP